MHCLQHTDTCRTVCQKPREPRQTGKSKGWLTFHVQALSHKQLVIARLVKESCQPCLIPDATVRLPLYQLLIPGNDCDPRQQRQLSLHLRASCLAINKEVEERHPQSLVVLKPDFDLIIAL